MPDKSALSHIPHPRGLPIVGHSLGLLIDPIGQHRRAAAQFGPVYKLNILGKWRVNLGDAEAVEFLLTDRNKALSSHEGWNMLQRLFGGGLMLRDFDDHRAHRRIMQTAFRKPVMDGYRRDMQQAVRQIVQSWPRERAFKSYPEIKTLTLRVGAAVFMGLRLDDPLVAQLNHDFETQVAAAVSPLQMAIPGTSLARGLKARKRMRDTLARLIPERRHAGGNDFFSQMVIAADEDGNSWTADEIVDHFNFMMMAAHDTTAAALVKIFWAMGADLDLQSRMRREIQGVSNDLLDDADLASLDLCDRVLKEALRLLPPVPFIPREAVAPIEYNGIKLPAGTSVIANVAMAGLSERFWTDPQSFDPDRFSPNRAEDQNHKFAWAPFGGGAHKCIGMHFATMQVKITLTELLRHTELTLPKGPKVAWKRIPIPQPRGGLPIMLHDISHA